MNLNIGSQMTQEEIEAYAKRMLALLREAKEGPFSIDPRPGVVLEIIRVCGRPIAKAEQEMIAEARRNAEVPRRGPSPVIASDLAFNRREPIE